MSSSSSSSSSNRVGTAYSSTRDGRTPVTGKSRVWQGAHFSENRVKWDPTIMQALVQKREAGEGGNPHWQFVVVFKQEMRVDPAARALGVNAFGMQRVFGENWAASINYVLKKETAIGEPIIEGDLPMRFGGNGKGNVWEWNAEELCYKMKLPARSPARVNSETAVRMIHDGSTLDELFEWNPLFMLNNQKKIVAYLDFFNSRKPNEMRNVEVTVLVGEPGVGKSRMAQEVGGADAYWLTTTPDGKLWFDGYTGQSTIVLDDFEGTCRIDKILHLLDSYSGNMLWEKKGGMVKLNHNKVIITSNNHPSYWYKGREDYIKIKALLRRCNVIHNLSTGKIEKWAKNEKDDAANMLHAYATDEVTPAAAIKTLVEGFNLPLPPLPDYVRPPTPTIALPAVPLKRQLTGFETPAAKRACSSPPPVIRTVWLNHADPVELDLSLKDKDPIYETLEIEPIDLCSSDEEDIEEVEDENTIKSVYIDAFKK